MDSGSFDRLARFVAGTASRRATLAGLVATLLHVVAPDHSHAQPRPPCRPLGRRCVPARGLACCSGTVCRDGRCQCPRGRRRCNGRCIPATRCCHDRCSGGAICRHDRCVCSEGKKRCRGRCIPRGACCRDRECGAGKECAGGRCRCRQGFKPCQGGCIRDDACCGGCPAPQVCRAGGCCIPSSAGLQAALAPGGPATIRLCPSTTYTGTFTIARTVTVIGAGPTSSILDGAGATAEAVVRVDLGVTEAELRGLQVTGGRRSPGAGILTAGELRLTDCLVTGNEAGLFGGGILAFDTLILDGTVVTVNSAGTGGGGGIMASGGDARVFLRGGSRVEDNEALAGSGGGIVGQAGATITLEDTSTVVNNDARFGGGVAVSNSTLILRGDSRIEANTATQRGGGVDLQPIVAAGSRLELYDRSQIIGNESLGGDDTGGGVFRNGPNGGTVEFFSPTAQVIDNIPDNCEPDDLCTPFVP